jgi:glycerophosphoryl diester phosphodiesterase
VWGRILIALSSFAPRFDHNTLMNDIRRSTVELPRKADNIQKAIDEERMLQVGAKANVPNAQEIHDAKLIHSQTGSPQPNCKTDAGGKGELDDDLDTNFKNTQQECHKLKCEVRLLKEILARSLKSSRQVEAAIKVYTDLAELEKNDMRVHEQNKDTKAAKESKIKYLAFNYELVELLIKVGSLENRERGLAIAKKTWQARTELEEFGTETKKSHRQYCALLSSRQDLQPAGGCQGAGSGMGDGEWIPSWVGIGKAKEV